MIIPKGTYIFRDVLEFPMTNSMEAEFPFTLSVYSNEYNVELTAECISICVSSVGSDGIGGLEYCVSSTVPDMSMVGYTFPFYCIVYASEPIMVDGKIIDGWNTVSFDNRMKTITLTLDTDVSNEFGSWFFANTKGIYFPLVKSLVIPEGKVSRITDALGRVLWAISSTPGGGDEPGYSGDPANFPTMKSRSNWRSGCSVETSTITEIEFLDTYNPTGNENESWYADENNTGSITCYRIGTKIIIAGNGSGGINAPYNCEYLFGGYGSSIALVNLQTIKNLSLLNTSNTFIMSNMFAMCKSIVWLNLSRFDTSNVQTMEQMFIQCEALETIDISNFNTSNVSTMKKMFDACYKLKTLDLSSFDTSNVQTMGSMFVLCTSLKTLDLSNFDLRSATYLNYMFRSCTNLTTIYVSRDKWVIRDDCTTTDMLTDCGTDHLTYI